LSEKQEGINNNHLLDKLENFNDKNRSDYLNFTPMSFGEATVIGRKQKGFGVAHVEHFVGFGNRFVNKKAQ
jgi:hypothetical protein